MSQHNPADCDYLAVVSEWSSFGERGGLVGNAYPLFNLTRGQAVAQPLDEFPNAGAVFLPSRGSLNTWDFVILRPRRNDRYRNQSERDCFYIPLRHPELIAQPDQLAEVAVILNHPAFDPSSPVRALLNPRHSVTPVFFVRRGLSFIGPCLRDVTHLSPMEDVQRIDWRPVGDEGVVYEFTTDDLTKRGVRLVEYSHPNKSLNRVLATPFALAVGPVRKLAPGKPLDALTDAALIDWYVQRCPEVDVTPQLLAALKAGFRGRPTDDPDLLQNRLRKIERQMATHAAFQEMRDRFARAYVESEEGQERVRELLEQAVARRGLEIQAEVDGRHRALAEKRVELDRQFAEAEREHRERLQVLARERDAAQRQVDGLREAAGQLQASLSDDAARLAARLSEQLPLLAALTASRPAPAAPASPVEPPRPARPAPEFRPIAPTAAIRPVQDEAKLVDELHADLARQGLHFARDFVANVYVCLKADALNLVIGPPGYGKSMMITALARSLGHGDAFLRIAVQRSWSEDRYLLGFYDNFHGRYDPGVSGLVPRMLQAEADWDQGRTGIYIVLLDEFNLAAPEYYFSQLLQVLPSDEPARGVVLYDDGQANGDGFPTRVALHPNLRFWGTINYDETTERLSPRLLDRTGMIFLGEADVRPAGEEPRPPMRGVAASDPFAKFLRQAEECPDERWGLIAPVIDLLRSNDPALGPRLELSPRVRRAIKRYLANSVDVLPDRAAVDFAVQQRILPVIRGRGDEFFARMTRLAQLLSEANLSRSAAHVAEAMRMSEQHFGEIDFLSY
jgi:hypothetical protein